MILDPELLKKAQAAGARLAEAEKELMLERGEYHAAIRRLHLGGGSFREIAAALALSHQRVQQIVEAAGGTWWSRIWRTRGSPPVGAVCTFCGRPPSEIAKLVSGPRVFICDGCIGDAERVLAGRAPRAGGSLALAGPRAKVTCSFCRATSRKQSIATNADAKICANCVRLAREIIEKAT